MPVYEPGALRTTKMKRTPTVPVLLTIIVVMGMAVPAMVLSTNPSEASSSGEARTVTAIPAQSAQSSASVNVTVGQQLSTVIDISSDEVQTDFANTAFEISLERASEEERAEAIADRADELRDRAESIREDYQEATEASQDGEITKSQYAQRLAALNARATNLLDSYDQLRQRTANVSDFELRAAGVNQSALSGSVTNLSGVTGTGAGALLSQFTGESAGEIELETEDGLSIEVESEDGERTREFTRPRDDTDAMTVGQSSAFETALTALSTPETGNWTLTEATVTHDEGTYEFAFALQNATNLAGEAEVDVDGSSGDVFALQEEVERRDDEDHDEDSDGELAMIVAEGTPAQNERITVQVLSDGAPVENVAVTLNDRAVGTTDGDGMVEVTLPASGEAELTAKTDDAEDELDFEFEEAEEDEEVFDRLAVDTTLDGDTVAGTVNYDDSSVENVSVYANGRAVGSTNSDGTVRFTIDTNATEELELELVKGAFEAELTYVVQDGDLILTEEGRDGEDEEDESDSSSGSVGDDQESDSDSDGEVTETSDNEDDGDDSEQ